MRNWKLVNKDKNRATLRHSSGHTMTLAIKSLHPGNQAELDKLPIHKDKQPKKEMPHLAMGGDPGADPYSEPTQAPAMSVPTPPASHPNWPQSAVADLASQDAEMAAPATIPQPSMPSNAPPQMPANSQVVPTGTPQEAVQQKGMDIQSGMNMQMHGIGQQANAESAFEKSKNSIYNGPEGHPELGAIAQEKNIMSHIQQVTQQHNDEIQSVVDDIKNSHIDPNRYLSSMDTGNKLATGIGLILGGIGGGGTHNMALDFLNKQIDRDIEGQKADVGRKENLVSLYSKMLGNERDGATMASNALAHITGDQIMAAAAKSGDPAAQARAEIAKGQLIQSYAPALMQMNLMRGMTNAQKETDKTPQQGPLNIAKMNQLAIGAQLKVPGYPTEADIGNMTKEAAALQEARATRVDFNNAFDSLNKDFLAGKMSPNARNSYINSLAGRLAKASAGRYNESEAKNQIESMIPEPSDWNSTRDIKRSNNDKFFDILESSTPTLDRFNLKNPPPQHPTADNRPAFIKHPKTGHRMQLVNGKYQEI